MTARMWRTASTMLPVPASPLVRIMRRALADAPQRLAEVAAAADERHAEGELVDVVVPRRPASAPRSRRCSRRRAPPGSAPRRSGRCGLGHHRDGDAFWISWIFFTGRPCGPRRPRARMSRGHALQRHHRRRARVLGDLRLLGVGDVHDDAALEHLGQADVLAIRESSVRSAPPWLLPLGSDERDHDAAHHRRRSAVVAAGGCRRAALMASASRLTPSSIRPRRAPRRTPAAACARRPVEEERRPGRERHAALDRHAAAARRRPARPAA